MSEPRVAGYHKRFETGDGGCHNAALQEYLGGNNGSGEV